MTLTQTIDSAYNLALDGFFNGEQFSKKRFADMVTSLMRTGNQYIFQMALPDGWWFCKITKSSWGYDLIVPETREQESRILDELLNR